MRQRGLHVGGGLRGQADQQIVPENLSSLGDRHVGLPDMGAVSSDLSDQMDPVVNDEGYFVAYISHPSSQSDEFVIRQVVVAELDQSHPAGDSASHGLDDLLWATTLGGVCDEVHRKIEVRP